MKQVVLVQKEIVERCSTLRIYEKRRIADDYKELVFYSKDTDQWHKIFTDILNPAIKPEGVKPTKDDLALTRDYGGISDNQTLFKKEYEDATVIAMFWPWQDGAYTTLKMISLQKRQSAGK